MEGARYLNCCLRTIWKCLPFQFQLFSVLFIYYGVAFFEIWKGKNIPEFRWLRPFALDHWYWLCLWFTGSSRWLDCWPVPSDLLWTLGWEFGLTSPISGLKIFLWLRYILRPLGTSANSSSLWSWFSSLDQTCLWTLFFSIVPFECLLLGISTCP